MKVNGPTDKGLVRAKPLPQKHAAEAMVLLLINVGDLRVGGLGPDGGDDPQDVHAAIGQELGMTPRQR